MVLDKLPYDVRHAGGVARTASVKVIQAVLDSVSIPIMAKCRIGHSSEASILEETGVDMIDESEVSVLLMKAGIFGSGITQHLL